MRKYRFNTELDLPSSLVCPSCDRIMTPAKFGWRGKHRRNVCRSCVAKATRRRLRLKVIAGYGGACACCGESTEQFLTIDHIGNNGHAERVPGHNTSLYRKLVKDGFPKDRYRLLCYNCNCSIGLSGYCPHHPDIRCEPAWLISRKTGQSRKISKIAYEIRKRRAAQVSGEGPDG